ncbi:HIT family protein [Streptomyces sp. NPDC059373]
MTARKMCLLTPRKRLVVVHRSLPVSSVMDCVFRTLVHADSTRWVFRGPTACAFAPLNQIAPGHALVIPTSHFADIFETPPQLLAETMAMVREVAATMRRALEFCLACGEVADEVTTGFPTRLTMLAAWTS